VEGGGGAQPVLENKIYSSEQLCSWTIWEINELDSHKKTA